jgi:phosphoribosylamine--glycine ligase
LKIKQLYNMNILVLGSGGREHALAWKLSQSQLCTNLFIAPGNAGTARVGTNMAIKISDFQAIKQLCLDKNIDLMVVGPEQPLVDGVVDFFKSDSDLNSIKVIGPDHFGAQLEGSKAFAKVFMEKYGIPTAKCLTVGKANLDDGKSFLESLNAPYVLKADGLAAGKGVLILDSLQEAKNELENMLLGKFGAASEKVVIEEFLSGIEVSVFVLSDGEHYVILPEAKDYKRIGDGDTGLNTGGMGAVSPVPFVTDAFLEKIKTRIIEPTLAGLKKENIEYKGFIFLGLMNVKGDPFVIEYNVRMGDPETEAVMARLDCDFAALLEACATGHLDQVSCANNPKTAVTVMMVSGGYPEAYKKGMKITGTESVEDCVVFHAGTVLNAENEVLTSGGRVIAVTALENSVEQAREKAYRNVSKINFEGAGYRHDVGLDVMKYKC